MEPEDEDTPDVPTISPPLQMAKQYLENANRIGEPGSPSMIEGVDLQHQHAEMAQTAALVTIAESLHFLADSQRSTSRRVTRAAGDLHTIASEITKLRYLLRRT